MTTPTRTHEALVSATLDHGLDVRGESTERLAEMVNAAGKARRPGPINLPPALSSLDRRPGHEAAFAELVDRRVNGAAGLMSQARRFYLAHAQTLGHEPVAWEELSVLTVRAWVAVAREARASYVSTLRGPDRDTWP